MPTAGWRQVPLMLFIFSFKIAGFLTPHKQNASGGKAF